MIPDETTAHAARWPELGMGWERGLQPRRAGRPVLTPKDMWIKAKRGGSARRSGGLDGGPGQRPLSPSGNWMRATCSAIGSTDSGWSVASWLSGSPIGCQRPPL